MDPSTAARRDLERHPVAAVVMGASAGGIAALQGVLGAMPDAGVPIFVVQHIDAETRAKWQTVFSACRLPVREATDKEAARPGTVYMAPPGYHLLIDAPGRLALSLDAKVNYARPSIDVLFESAARAYGLRLLGVVLTGANADGAAGLAAIRRAGGLCWVESPETAAMPVMPSRALTAVPDARVLSLGEMAEAFAGWHRAGALIYQLAAARMRRAATPAPSMSGPGGIGRASSRVDRVLQAAAQQLRRWSRIPRAATPPSRGP